MRKFLTCVILCVLITALAVSLTACGLLTPPDATFSVKLINDGKELTTLSSQEFFDGLQPYVKTGYVMTFYTDSAMSLEVKITSASELSGLAEQAENGVLTLYLKYKEENPASGDEPARVNGIAFVSGKTTFYMGEELTTADWTVNALYTDGTSCALTPLEYTVSGYNKDVAQSFNATVTLSANVGITCNVTVTYVKVARRLGVKNATRLFVNNEVFSMGADALVEVYYTASPELNESGDAVAARDYTIDSSAFRRGVPGEYAIKVYITSLPDVFATYKVAVRALPVSVSVSDYCPTVTYLGNYQEGNIKVALNFADGSSRAPDANESTAVALDKTALNSNAAVGTTGTVTLKFHYSYAFSIDGITAVRAVELSVPFSVTVASRITELRLSEYPTSFEYKQPFTSEGLTVTAVYSDGRESVLAAEDYTVDSSAYLAAIGAGTYEIIVSGKEGGRANYQVSVNPPVRKQLITTGIPDVPFAQNLTSAYIANLIRGKTVKAEYVYGYYSEEVPSYGVTYEVTNYSPYRSGTQTVTLTAGGVSGTLTVNLATPLIVSVTNRTSLPSEALLASITDFAYDMQMPTAEGFDLYVYRYFGEPAELALSSSAEDVWLAKSVVAENGVWRKVSFTAQPLSYIGMVYDENGARLSGVTIKAVGYDAEAISNADGAFRLVFSALGADTPVFAAEQDGYVFSINTGSEYLEFTRNAQPLCTLTGTVTADSAPAEDGTLTISDGECLLLGSVQNGSFIIHVPVGKAYTVIYSRDGREYYGTLSSATAEAGRTLNVPLSLSSDDGDVDYKLITVDFAQTLKDMTVTLTSGNKVVDTYTAGEGSTVRVPVDFEGKITFTKLNSQFIGSYEYRNGKLSGAVYQGASTTVKVVSPLDVTVYIDVLDAGVTYDLQVEDGTGEKAFLLPVDNGGLPQISTLIAYGNGVLQESWQYSAETGCITLTLRSGNAEQYPTYKIYGIVTNLITGSSIKGAEVAISVGDSTISMNTDAFGTYCITLNGTGTLSATVLGVECCAYSGHIDWTEPYNTILRADLAVFADFKLSELTTVEVGDLWYFFDADAKELKPYTATTVSADKLLLVRERAGERSVILIPCE